MAKSNRRKHTIWPAELWEQVEAYAQSVRRATGEQYPDDQRSFGQRFLWFADVQHQYHAS